MHPIILLALGALGGWAAYKWLNVPDEKKKKVKNAQSNRQSAPSGQGDAEDLVQDPETGVFRTKKD